MAINLQKSSGASKGSTPSGNGINSGIASIGLETAIGEVGGVQVTASQELDLKLLVPAGRISGGITADDAGNQTLDLGIGGKISTPYGAFGVGIGGSIRRDKEGNITAESSSVSASVAGIGVSVATDKEGNTSATICYEYGISRSCIGLGPAEEKGEEDVPYVPPIIPSPSPIQLLPIEHTFIPPGDPECIFLIGQVIHSLSFYPGSLFNYAYNYSTESTWELELSSDGEELLAQTLANKQDLFPIYHALEVLGTFGGSTSLSESYAMTLWSNSGRDRTGNSMLTAKGKGKYYLDVGRLYKSVEVGTVGFIWETQSQSKTGDMQAYPNPSSSRPPLIMYGKASEANKWVNEWNSTYSGTAYSVTQAHNHVLPGMVDKYYRQHIINRIIIPAEPRKSPSTPNQPQEKEPMNCCDKVNEIYKYLGIEKLKRNKFPISNAFLAPSGTGNQDCVDHYEIQQALFRMLANGLILNPKSEPGGTPYQNSNATSWASAMFEMQAESMSDGNQSQKVEVSMMMAISQLTMLVAELTKKVEFIADSIGFDPELTVDYLPICFTIHESHEPAKGFDPKKKRIPKQIDTKESTKTDDDTEKTISKMLNASVIPITAWKTKRNGLTLVDMLRS